MLFIQEPGDKPVEQKECQRIGQTPAVIPEEGLPQAVERERGPMPLAERLPDDFAEYVDGQGIHPHHDKGKRPPALFQLIDKIDERGQDERGSPASHQHEARRPQPLVQRCAIAPQITEYEHHRTPNGQFHNLCANLLFLDDNAAAQETDHHLSHRGDCAQHPFGVDKLSATQIHVRRTQHGKIDNRHHILGTLFKAVAKELKQIVPHQQHNDYRREEPMPHRDRQKCNDAVADTQSLQDAHDAQILERIAFARRNPGQDPFEGYARQDYQESAPQNASDRNPPVKPALIKRQKNRHSHDEQEGRENEVGRRKAVPPRMFQRGVGIPASLIPRNTSSETSLFVVFFNDISNTLTWNTRLIQPR